MIRENVIDVLAFGPHPDDVEMGCGGTLIKLKKSGYSIGIIDLSGGEMGTRGTEKIRAREAAEAARILDVNFRENLNLGDSRIWNNDENRKKIVHVIRTHRPRIIFAAFWLDDHPDHVQSSFLIKDAFYMSGLKNVSSEKKSYKPKEIIYYMCRQEFEPSFIVDITHEFNRKMDAIKAYSSQLYNKSSPEPETPLSHPDFLDMFVVRAQFFGKMIGCKFGEPFYTKYPPPVEDPVAIWK